MVDFVATQKGPDHAVYVGLAKRIVMRSSRLTPERLEQHEQAASLVGSASIESSLNQSSVSPDDDFDGQPHGSIGLWFESRQAHHHSLQPSCRAPQSASTLS